MSNAAYSGNLVRHRSDTVKDQIVKGLRKCGYKVWIIERPADLLVGWGNPPHLELRMLEVKTPTKTGKRRKRKDQEEQDLFLAETGTPIVMSVEQALEAIRAK